YVRPALRLQVASWNISTEFHFEIRSVHLIDHQRLRDLLEDLWVAPNRTDRYYPEVDRFRKGVNPFVQVRIGSDLQNRQGLARCFDNDCLAASAVRSVRFQESGSAIPVARLERF